MPKRPNVTPQNAEVIDVLADDPLPTGTDSPVPLRQPDREPDREPEREPVRERPVPASRTLRLIREKQDATLTPDQVRIKELEDRLAKEMGRKDPDQEFEVADPDGETILIHFVADGFTALGHIWYRGQELEFTVGSPAYNDTRDRYGWSWLSLRDDAAAQEARYKEVKFRSGPWPGAAYADAATKARFEPLKDVKPLTEADLAVADRAEARRRRAAPRLPLS